MKTAETLGVPDDSTLRGTTGEFDDGYRLPDVKQPKIPDWAGNPDVPRIKKADHGEAQRKGLREFISVCWSHGPFTMFDTETGACFLCLDDNRGLPVQAQYRAAGGTCYVETCAVHGDQITAFGKHGCRECNHTRSPRAQARKERRSTFLKWCDKHGSVEHSVSRGDCLTCFTTSGMPRTGTQRTSSNPERAQARATGATSYMGECETHGRVPHHTIRGKCLTCFNSLGYPRPGPKG